MANDAISKTTSLITHATNEYKNKLEAVRQQRNELLNEIELIKISPLPLTDVIARVEAFVSSNNLITGLDSFFYPYETNNRLLTVETIPDTAPVYVVNDMLATKFRSSVNLAGVLCSLFGDTIKKTLVDAVTQEADFYPPGPPLAERPGLISGLQEKIHSLEIEEEALICEAKAVGIGGVYRRGDINPEIVLMMEVADA